MMAYSFEIWYSDTREDFCGDLEAIFSQVNLDFFKDFSKILFLEFLLKQFLIFMIFFEQMVQFIYIYKNVCMYLFVVVVEKVSSSFRSIVNFIAM